MSDLLDPIITVMTGDYDAFWCFVGFMKKARHNFRLDEVGIRRQLGKVSKIIKFKDSHLFKHLEMLQAEDCFFVYRMVVVLFRRELTFEQTICLWEVMWADQAAIRAGIGKSAWSIRQSAMPTEDLLLYAIAPDLTAPGVEIVASWSEATTVTGITVDKRVVPFNIISGTSMSCPHATGAAAYVKSFHPTWSPAAIKSALMTTASTLSAAKNINVEFAYGSGQINPIKAAQPGLIYDAGEAEFVSFLCGQGYSSKSLQLVTGDNTTCSAANNGTVWDLNYPSFALSAPSGTSFIRTFQRTVTNVGTPVSTYKATVNSLPGLNITVLPSVLSFKAIGQKLSFTVTAAATVSSKVLSGSLVWDDGAFQVRSPVVAYSTSS